MSLWLESWIPWCGVGWSWFSSPLTLVLRQSLFTPESVFQRFIAPFITMLLYTPGAWLLMIVCQIIWTSLWWIFSLIVFPLGIVPLENLVAVAVFSFVSPIALLTAFIRVTIENILTAGRDRGETYFWLFTLFLVVYVAFLTAVLILNDLFFAAVFRACSIFTKSPVNVIENAPESAGIAPASPGRLVFLRKSIQETMIVLLWIGGLVAAAIGPMAGDFMTAALETKAYDL